MDAEVLRFSEAFGTQLQTVICSASAARKPRVCLESDSKSGIALADVACHPADASLKYAHIQHISCE